MPPQSPLRLLCTVRPRLLHYPPPKLGYSYIQRNSKLHHVSNFQTFSSRRALGKQRSAAGHRSYSTNSQVQVFRLVKDIRQHRSLLREQTRSVGLVPTMGAFHEGHLQLVRKAAQENDDIFISIYVNPTQFGVNEDLDAYPRTFESDMMKIYELNTEFQARKLPGRVTAVFAPTTLEMYPSMPPSSEIGGHGSFVTITPVGSLLEGASRPVFFRGVATVCMKLFNIMTPDRVYFGQKDIQQTVIINRLVKDFHLGTEVRIVPTMREPDGLAMSSRNVYLGERRRAKATILHTALEIAESQFKEQGIRDRTDILGPANSYAVQELQDQLDMPRESRVLFELDYISLADPDTMQEVDVVDENKGAILSGALIMLPIEDMQEGEDPGENDGVHRRVRLIDNIILPGEDHA